MKKLKMPVILSALFFLFSCGIEEYYYLPQVPEGNITRISNTRAEIKIPSIDSVEFYYATGYIIFYRIYISDYSIVDISMSEISQISPMLAEDFNIFEPYTNPANTLIPNVNTFRSRNYFELEIDGDIQTILKTTGGTVNIIFSDVIGTSPSLTQGVDVYNLFRSNPEQDRYFFNTEELRASTNADVSKRVDVDGQHAYVSMYIVAVGLNPAFSRIYSKPTHINIFRLPERN